MGKASRKKKFTGKGRMDDNGVERSSGVAAYPARKNETGSRAKLSLMTIIILLSCFSAYFNSLSDGFVYDDTLQVLKNPWITDTRHIPEIFFKSVWSFQGTSHVSNYYRPIMHLIYMLNFHIFGLKPWGFHLVNMLIHAGVSLLVFVIVSRLLRESRAAPPVSYLPSFIAAMLFATHPIHTEAVTWVAGLPDLSFTFFYLLSFYFYMKSEDSSSRFHWMYLLSVASFFLSTLCKEPALTLPLILVIYDLVFKKERVQFTSSLKRYIPYVIVAGVYFMMRLRALGGFAPLKRHAELSAGEYFINIFPLFMQYLKKLILPTDLNAYYVFHPISSILQGKGILSLIITIAFIVITIVFLKKNKLVSFGLLFIVVPLLPALYIPALGRNTFTERYLYISSFGFVLILASLIDWVKVNKPAAAAGLTTVFLVMAAFYCWATVGRNATWRNDYTLFEDMVRKSPDGDIPHYNFGNSLLHMGKLDAAIQQYQIAFKLNPDYADAHNNLGLAYYKKGWMDEAINQYQIALKLKPDNAEAHSNLGITYFNKGAIDEAIEQYQIALRLEPDYVDAHSNLALAYLNKGRTDEAIEQCQIALKLEPDYAAAHNNLGLAYYNKGWMDKAIEQYQIGVELNPDYAEAHNGLGAAYFNRGQVDKAIEQWQIALRINPNYAEAKENLAIAHGQENSLKGSADKKK